VRSVIPLALELPGVFVTRSMSKAHGMAGLRVGYALGQPETVQKISAAWELGSMNTLSAAAAAASLRDAAHIEDERRENARVREFTLQAFRDMGYQAPDTHANFVFLDLGRTAAAFRDACLEGGVRVGRDFPPLERTHSRISLGTMEEMEASVRVFRQVLQGATAGA
jgi:histidinol-phosphate aminotransferase